MATFPARRFSRVGQAGRSGRSPGPMVSVPELLTPVHQPPVAVPRRLAWNTAHSVLSGTVVPLQALPVRSLVRSVPPSNVILQTSHGSPAWSRSEVDDLHCTAPWKQPSPVAQSRWPACLVLFCGLAPVLSELWIPETGDRSTAAAVSGIVGREIRLCQVVTHAAPVVHSILRHRDPLLAWGRLHLRDLQVSAYKAAFAVRPPLARRFCRWSGIVGVIDRAFGRIPSQSVPRPGAPPG